MAALKSQLRKDLERVIIKARNLVVADVTDRLKELNVHEGKRGALSDTQANLRVRLRAHGKQIGDIRNSQSDAQQIDRLVQECAYEQWHRMIFVRFLAENEFLIDPEYGQSVSMEALVEIAEESKVDPWVLGGQFASTALPAIFREDDPLLEVRLSQETQRALNDRLSSLPPEVFTADDSLGWVYQFWQSEEKDRVNASGDKIDGRSIPAVTQLFTEHYMVLFLLHNTLGAWHASKVLAKNPTLAIDAKDEAELRRAVALETAGGYEFEYLRFVKVEEASSLLHPSNSSDETSTSNGEFKLPYKQLVRKDKSQDGSSTFDHKWFDWKEPIHVDSGNLPHVKQEGVTYFVTFRTADSLPADKWKAWQAERDAWLAANPKPHTDEQKKEYYEKFPAKIEYWLDQRYGSLELERSDAKKLVDDALHHFEGDRYLLDEYVVAANHVHVLVTPLGDNDLSDILHSWKSFTANKINKLLEKSGTFWQKESFDHAVRSPESLEKFRSYIRNHKVEAASSRLTEPPEFVSEEGDEYTVDSSATKSQDGSSTWRPMGGTYEGWPRTAAELKVLDPSCGSGHFLVAAFELLVRLRMHEESLSIEAAAESVLRDNLFGLEIDPRCTQIAAFNIAMAVWKLFRNQPQGVSPRFPALPPMRNIACSGIPLGNSRDDWMKALKSISSPRPASGRGAGGEGLADLGFQWGQLYDMFSKANTLGSLINPQRFFGSGLLTDEQLKQISDALSTIIVDDPNATDEQQELAAAAQGLTRATELLAGRYTLVITNVPYLGRGKQDDELKKYLDTQYALGKADLATAFVLRCLEFCQVEAASSRLPPNFQNNTRQDAASTTGSIALVTPQNWLFLTTYKKLRETLLERRQWDFVARLGPGAFETIGGHVVNVSFLGLTASEAVEDHQMAGIDVAAAKEPGEKATQLCGQQQTQVVLIPQGRQLDNPDARIIFTQTTDTPLLDIFASVPNGLPEPESDDPTQWLFHGWPDQVEAASSRLSGKSTSNKSQDGSSTLQVAVARLLGYRWPAELDSEMRLSQRARELVARCSELDEFIDDDGIICIPSVRGEDPASDRLLRLLNAAGVNHNENLELWLREKFFQEHCELFHQRPFIWHIWDGRKDGFAALVNYHKLVDAASSRVSASMHKSQDGSSTFHQGKKLLENLTYSYLGDWIIRQEAAVKNNESGADDRLLAAKELQGRLEAILHGEPPYDIFVRWKPLHEQPIGWTPDINDGVRMNIRPFMLAELSRGRRGAGVLRFPPKIKWTKDRGKEPKRPIEDYPWFWDNVDAASSRVDYEGKSQDGSSTFTGDRWNDLHYSIAVKQAARDAAKNREAQS